MTVGGKKVWKGVFFWQLYETYRWQQKQEIEGGLKQENRKISSEETKRRDEPVCSQVDNLSNTN